MARTRKNPNVDRLAPMPFDKDEVLPVRQVGPKGRPAAAGAGTNADIPAPSSGPPPAGEEYPGPQTASSGRRVEPGRPRPTKSRDR